MGMEPIGRGEELAINVKSTLHVMCHKIRLREVPLGNMPVILNGQICNCIKALYYKPESHPTLLDPSSPCVNFYIVKQCTWQDASDTCSCFGQVQSNPILSALILPDLFMATFAMPTCLDLFNVPTPSHVWKDHSP